MSEQTADDGVVIRIVTEGSEVRFIVDATHIEDPKERREIETRVGEAAVDLFLAVAEEHGVDMQLTEMCWRPERIEGESHAP